MGYTLYYSATRDTPLTPEELAAIKSVDERYTDKPLIEYLSLDPEEGCERLNFDAFTQFPPDDPRTIFDGSTGIPSEASGETLEGTMQYWLNALSEIRRAVSNATWSVSFEDEEAGWDEETQTFVIPRPKNDSIYLSSPDN